MTLAVLHVAQPRDAGVPRVVSALVADQVARGWDVSVASPPDGDLERTTPDTGARWLSWPAGRAPGPGSFAESRRLAAIVRQVSPDLVHLHSAKAGLAGRLVLRGRLPTVFQPHAWSFEAASGPVRAGAVLWERIGARWTDVVVCVSGGERATGERAGVGARYAEVPNGVDLTSYTVACDDDRAAARQALGIDPSAPLAVVVGRLARQKGQDVLLAAWPRVRARVPDSQLVLVGDGPDRQALEAAAPPAVRFAGQSNDVAKWYAAATVVVIPSRWEGLSLVVIEAMARGRSVVASDVAGMSQALEGGAGALVAPEAPAPLADALADRLADPALADAEGVAGRARVEQRFDLRVTAERIAELYADTLARRSS